MSGTVNSMQELFAQAASLLLGNALDAAKNHEAKSVLEALEYGVESGERIDPKNTNRAHLLLAASRFARVFELASPDAPGLISFGAQFDPALADPLHSGSPLVSVSGVGLTLQEAFQGCIGEGIEYLSQLQTGTDLLFKPGVDDWSGKLNPNALELVVRLSERRLQPERALSWCRATRQADGGAVWLPADICLRRPPVQRDFVPPFPLSIGSAAGPSRDAAALHGLLELIERDAASLWWRGGQLARSIPAQDPACIVAEELLEKLRHGVSSPRRTWLLDITTDIGVPCVAAVSCRADGSGFACGLAARPALDTAARSAIVEMCQGELADAIVAAKRGERGDDALNVQDRTHLRRAAINADQCKLLQPTAEYAAHLPLHATEASVIFELIVQRLEQLGINAFCIDLTRECFAVPVVRVIVPGLQLEPSEIVTARLQDTVARTGGGSIYTGGVPLI
ncbi:YcaO-like family protein [Bradyrhizobium sp. WSM 1738]|uniref:YcaO-like family protein n=1 Tax=Bradyrhizobium hereditatis TaxID=2821405 RepID=UPI001CE23C89|nr:YcaO-like family protein [Bradyrhizobium hereditatis]MCA6119086.1 YcaO-like family protein [Bradyrhizobium hereditatis]